MSGGDRRGADAVLLQHLAAGQTVANAARLAGVSEPTAYRRLRDAGFRGKLAQLRAEAVERAMAMLTTASTGAVAVLVSLSRQAEAESVQLGAAKAILDLGCRWREQGELADRLAALEAAIGPDGDGLRRVL